jgi:hypothetical protein
VALGDADRTASAAAKAINAKRSSRRVASFAPLSLSPQGTRRNGVSFAAEMVVKPRLLLGQFDRQLH